MSCSELSASSSNVPSLSEKFKHIIKVLVEVYGYLQMFIQYSKLILNIFNLKQKLLLNLILAIHGE